MHKRTTQFQRLEVKMNVFSLTEMQSVFASSKPLENISGPNYSHRNLQVDNGCLLSCTAATVSLICSTTDA